MFGLGFSELVVLLVVVLLLFGPSRLPQLMESIGEHPEPRKGLREPLRSMSPLENDSPPESGPHQAGSTEVVSMFLRRPDC
jgi:TatA/E family protein of Tat protein translocase